jgi:hypothetical protein
MDRDLREKLESIAGAVKLPDTIRHICVCKAGYLGREREMKLPGFVQSRSALNVNVWLMPETAAGFRHREELDRACAEIEKLLGGGYTVGVCPMKNDILMNDGFYVTIN